MTVDDATFAVGALIEFAHAMFAQEREVVSDLFQLCARPDFFPLAGIGAARNGSKEYIRSLFA